LQKLLDNYHTILPEHIIEQFSTVNTISRQGR
jgi:hypothetical protein